MKDKLKEMVYNDGLHILLDRLSILYSNYELEKLLHPVIVKATIVNMDTVVSKIKEKWHTCFNIKDIEIDLKRQELKFKYFGGPYFVPKKYSSFIILGQDEWSPVKTEYCDYERTTEEQYAEKDTIKLIEFKDHGIEMTIV